MLELTIQYDESKEPFVHYVDKDIAPLATMALADKVGVEYQVDDDGQFVLDDDGEMIEMYTIEERAVIALSNFVNKTTLKYQKKELIKAANEAGQIKTVTVTGD